MLKSVSIQHVRNITGAEFELSPCLTVFQGDNGAGKSSLLEAVFLLGRAGTFRTRQLNSVITAGKQGLKVEAQLDGGTKLSFIYSKAKGSQRTSGMTPLTLRESAQLLPCVALTADSLQLVSGAPSERRSFIDWLVFHVKHSFFQHWQHYRTCLNQRNAVLRKPEPSSFEQARLWAHQMQASALAIHDQRKEILSDLADAFEEQFGDMFRPDLGGVRVSYAPGWDTRQDWQHLQDSNFEQDCRRARTEYGPHRADLKVYVGDKLAADVLSRGQQKALVMRLYLTLLNRFSAETGRTCLVLVDDLTSELDPASAQYIAQELVQTRHQVVTTILAENPFLTLELSDTKMFHVKHGALTVLT